MQKDIARFQAAWRALQRGRNVFAYAAFERRRASLTPQQVARLDQPFRARARPWHGQHRAWSTSWLPKPKQVDWEAIFIRDPSTALLAMHAADGHLREYAVKVAPMNDTAALAVLLLRCNDWVDPVRRAAFARLKAVLPLLDQEALAPLCLFTLVRVVTWGRGGGAAADMLMAHPAWPMAVEQTFTQTALGPLARALRQLLQEPTYDWMLPRLAMGAQSAFVRAIAVTALLTGYARWKTGYEWVWHDKVFGLRRKVPTYDKRSVAVTSTTRDTVFRQACFDKSARVRALAADHLIIKGPDGHTDLVDLLRLDKAPSVQDRMEYYAKKWS